VREKGGFSLLRPAGSKGTRSGKGRCSSKHTHTSRILRSTSSSSESAADAPLAPGTAVAEEAAVDATAGEAAAAAAAESADEPTAAMPEGAAAEAAAAEAAVAADAEPATALLIDRGPTYALRNRKG